MGAFRAELKWFQNHIKIPKIYLSRLFKTSEKTISQLEYGKKKPTPKQKWVLTRLALLIKKLSPDKKKMPFKNKKGFLKWLERPLPALDNSRPADCLETNEKFQRLLALLKELGL